MKFPKAQAGIRRVFTAELLALIGAACVFIAIIPLLGGIALAVNQGALGFLTAGSIITLILMLAFLVLSIIAFILRLVGLGTASKDDPKFKTAFILAICSLAGAVVGSILSTISSASSSSALAVIGFIITILSSIAGLLVEIFVILGIRSISTQLDNIKLASSAKTLLIIIIIIYALEIIAVAIAFISLAASMVAGSLATIYVILLLVSAILGIVKYILYLVLLGRAKKAFLE